MGSRGEGGRRFGSRPIGARQCRPHVAREEPAGSFRAAFRAIPSRAPATWELPARRDSDEGAPSIGSRAVGLDGRTRRQIDGESARKADPTYDEKWDRDLALRDAA